MFGINEIWLLLGLPLLCTLYLVLFHKKSVVWWELLIVWGVSILAIFISQLAVERYLVSDLELWGFNGVRATYDEPFQYWDTCSETYACGESCSGSGSNRTCSTQYCTRYYPCKQWGGDRALLYDQTGGTRHISRAKFKHLEKNKWQNTKTIELHRERTYKIIVDGDRRETLWPKTWQTAEPIAETHTYENRTQSSTTIRFLKVTKEDVERYGLFEYPIVRAGYEAVTVVDSSGRHWAMPDQKFRYVNGVLGPKRFLRIWILIFRDQPREAFHYQESYWKNGNKNEFIICIGADKAGNIQWGDVISWTEVEELKIEFRDYVQMRMKKVSEASLLELADQVQIELGTRYVKPEFTDKFKHLSVQPSLLTMVLVGLIILLVNVGVAVWVVQNGIDEDGIRPKRYSRGRRTYRRR